MGYRDLDLYHPDQPVAPPQAPPPGGDGRRSGAVRRRPGRRSFLVFAAVTVVMVGGTAWRVRQLSQSPVVAPAASASPASTASGSLESPTSAASASATSPASVPPSRPPTPDQAAMRAARTAVTQFVEAWARPGQPKASWLAGVRRYATPELAGRLASVDPRNVPATTVLSIAQEGFSDAGGTYLVVTDGPRLQVAVRLVGGRWQVASIEPVGGGLPVPSAAATASASAAARI